MRKNPVPRFLFGALLLCLFGLLSAGAALADNVYGSIRGTVTDPSGAVVAGVKVTATNVATGVAATVTSNAAGDYAFVQLPAPGNYDVTAEIAGFETYQAHHIPLQLNQIYVLNLKMEVGTTTQEVTVEANAAQVETTSIELGTTVDSKQIVDLPLNGRNWVQLQQLEPGVVAASDGRGSFATNGSQAAQNSYLINGTDNNDFPLNTNLITPSPDAIGEFKMVTNTINPEYGRNSGAILNAVIKGGSNAFHGDGFDFYRDTSLNSRNFFQPKPQVFHQNQFGGTIGGPIWKDHTFFFFSYQGNRNRQPELSNGGGNTPVFTADQRNGTGGFTDLETSTKTSPFPLVGDNGQTFAAGTPYSTIFSQGFIPTADFNTVSSGLLNKFVPLPNAGSNFQFNPIITGVDDQYLERIDHTFSPKDAIWGYALWERNPTVTALPFTGATLPGFAEVDARHYQQYTLAWNHTFGGTTLNEARFGYSRFNFQAIAPQNPVSPSSAGFTGIVPQQQGADQSLPVVTVNGLFNLGFSGNGPQPRIDQVYQVTDNLTKVAGAHTLKFGFDMRRFEVYNPFLHNNDGSFTFAGAGSFSTGNAGADFLLGIPDSYAQGSGDILNSRTREYYSYAQDQWKMRPNFTLTYGVGWTIDTPLVDNYHNNHATPAFRPGQQSALFPTAPAGYVLQGDVSNAYGTTHYKDFGPRIGFAYSPSWGWLTGGAGSTSIRGGFGLYFNRFEGETALQFNASPPFAQNSLGVGDIGLSPSFANPFTDVAGRGSLANKFPFAGPTSNINFALFEPLSISVFDPNITVPYAENFNFTIERQLGSSTILSLGYVGALAHHEVIAYELNPGINAAGCAANPTCTGNSLIQNLLFPNNFAQPGNIFGSIGNVATVGNSNYNAFQASLNRHFAHGLQFQAAYTWSRSMDNGSGFENSGFGGGGFGGFGSLRGSNPFNRNLDYGPSIFDATNRLVINYDYALPSVRRFNSMQWVPSRLTDGWTIAGITTLQSGFPLDVIDSGFRSLTCTAFTFYQCPDVPNVVAPAQYFNPRNSSPAPGLTGNYFFNPNGFAPEAFGTFGNAGRNLLRGPGINNFDFSLFKDTRITESTRLELRFEFFNLFNHTQFNPGGIVTDINAGSAFGQEFSARPSRLIQLGAKFYF
ncbi:MAG TPA: carboxypeptidase regulatory-like domain-containing protein [Terriglobia bacterium]|nr:carboxypeptidase regulatory-like domain-containing protein [Terriglobia bacterium]